MPTFSIIGGGLVGLATAWKLSQRFPDARIEVFEKEKSPCLHQSGNNSGVLHCGLYYRPGSLKARLAVAGIREMTKFCREHSIPHEICGKMVVATSPEEVRRLDDLEVRGRQNGLQGLRRLRGEAIREREPFAAGIEALEVPEEGIVDYQAIGKVLCRLLLEKGHRLHFGQKVLSGRSFGRQVRLHLQDGETITDFVINCSGLYSDRICRSLGGSPSVKIIPFRGEYYQLKPESRHLVRHLIYPVPDPVFPFLGVHFTRLIGGGIEAGPNAVLAFSREGYRLWDFRIEDFIEAAAFPGLWKFVSRYRRMCLAEFRQSVSPSLFCRSLQKLVPSIRESDLEPGGSGVRAQAMSHDGKLVEDFSIIREGKMLHLLNAPSPAATASLAIGSEIAAMI